MSTPVKVSIMNKIHSVIMDCALRLFRDGGLDGGVNITEVEETCEDAGLYWRNVTRVKVEYSTILYVPKKKEAAK